MNHSEEGQYHGFWLAFQSYLVGIHPLLWLAAALAAGSLALWLDAAPLLQHSIEHYLLLHMVLETFSIVVALLVFAVGWHSHQQEPQNSVLVVACAFLAVGLLDFAHMLSYPDMLHFVLPAVYEKAMHFSLAARLISATALFGVALDAWGWLSHLQTYQRPLMGTTSLLLVGAVCGAVLFESEAVPQSLAALHRLLLAVFKPEYVIILLYLATAAVLLRKPQRSLPLEQQQLCAAVIILALSELFFVLRSSTDDVFSLLEHSYKVAAYVFIYRAFFVYTLQKPYEQLRRERLALRGSEECLRLISRHARDVIYRYRLLPAVRFDFISESITDLSGYTPAEYYANPSLAFRCIHPEDRQHFRQFVRQRGICSNQVLTVRWIRADGAVVWVEQHSQPVYDEAGTLIAIEGVARDITHYRNIEEQISALSFYDALTHLPNRMLFYDRLQQAILQAQPAGKLVAVLLVDIDRFKAINDTLGHGCGDLLLKSVANRLQQLVSSSDTIARLEGDEFALVLSNIATAQDSAIIAQKTLQVLSEPFYLEGREVFTTASVGITLYPDDAHEPDILLKCADVTMERVKAQGRNGYAFYTADMQVRTVEWLTLESEMRQAIPQHQFCLHYQPQIDLHTGRTVGVEALVRWQHPRLGLLTPGRFIPIAEESSLIIPLGLHVLRLACRQHVAWLAQGLPPLRMAVNLSLLQLARPEIVSEIAQIIAESGIDPQYLELELTESMFIRDAEVMVARLHALKALGVQLAIDDFGTGYSSLSYLKRLPIDTLKIDRSFVHDILDDSDSATIATTIIAMAHSLKLKVIAEGVEDACQELFLQQQHCDEVQGYLHGRPVPADQIPRLLQRVSSPGFIEPHNLHNPHASHNLQNGSRPSLPNQQTCS